MSLQHRLVQVLPYDPNWPRLFEEESALITPIFQSINGVSHGNSESLAQQVYGNSESLTEQVNRISESAAKQLIIHHIGSTSVPRLAAKPIIDILSEVPDIEQLGPADYQEPGVFTENSESLAQQVNENSIVRALQALGYEPLGEYGLPGRRYFRKLDGKRHLVHLHCYQSGNPEIKRHLAFRDYLRAHPDVAQEYGELKIKLAATHRRSSEDYQSEKDVYVEKMEKVALEWYGAQAS